MQTYKTPGVYINEIDAFPMSVVGVDTAIPVFVGKTKLKVPNSEPVLINTLAEYIEKFGTAQVQEFTATIGIDEGDPSQTVLEDVSISGLDEKVNLYYQMQMFFANGGGTCYVMSVEDYPSSSFDQFLQPLATKEDITMVVLADIADETNYIELCNTALKQCAELNRFLLIDTEYGDDSEIATFRASLANDYLKYGAAYTPYLNTSLTYVYTDDDGENSITIKNSDSTDKDALKALLGVDRLTWAEIKTKNTQMYNQILAAVANKKIKNFPPTGAMAGIYAKTDKDKGVWMAPANVSLNAVVAPSDEITADQQASLNIDATSGKSVNAIRHFPGKGNLVWGARTLDGNSNDWRYIAVRRTVSYVEQSLNIALQAYVFEANNAMTWLTVTTMIEAFLEKLYKEGGLAGSTAGDAFFVNLGLGSTMTPQDILEGRMKISIGLAVVRPAEFIILDVTQLLQK